MVEEILEPIIGFLCPTPDSASACRDFISSHSSVLPPIGPLFYFLLFPAVFTIVFIFILMGSVVGGGLKEHAGLRILVGVTAFIFIIISGWYPIMLVLSEFWYIAAIILAGFWYFIGSHFGKSGGGGGGGGKGGGMSAPIQLLKAGIVTQKMHTSGELNQISSHIDSCLTVVEETRPNKGKNDSESRAYVQAMEAANFAIKSAELEFKKAKIPGTDRSTLQGLIEEKQKLLKRIQNGEKIFTKKP